QSYSWMPAGTGSSIVVTPLSAMVYTVEGKDGACIATATVEVQTQPVPTINIAASATMICAGESVTLQASGGDSYTWSDPNLSGANVVATPSTHTAFQVTGTNSLGCTSSAQQVVLVNPSPTVAL